MSTRSTVIVISDSRGRGLSELIDHSSDIDFIFKVLPGKTLQDIATVVDETLSNYQHTYYYCIVLSGICSLTVRSFTPLNCLRYHLSERESKVAAILDTINDLKFKYGARINICTFVPACLIKYFNIKNPDHPEVPGYLIPEQEALLEDITQINDEIKQFNLNYRNTNINLCGRFVTHSKKKHQRSNSGARRRVTKFKDTELTDGVHFSDSIKRVCCDLIRSAAVRDLEQLKTSTDKEESLTSSQESLFTLSDQEWDFKRKSST
jgi:hypothetical protein